MQHVWMFDIDGTLISTGGAGQTAMALALARGFGKPADTSNVPFAGRTDRSIARDLFALYDIPDTSSSWEHFQRHYLEQLAECLPRCPGRVLPGVVELLDQLAADSNVLLGLLTGNTPEGARRKLEHFGLYEYFKFGAFGDLCLDRDAVAGEAHRQCCAMLGDGVQPAAMWVVGDTPHDIRCARAIGARAIAVATGNFDRQSLALHAPHVLVETLAELPTASLLIGEPYGAN